MGTPPVFLLIAALSSQAFAAELWIREPVLRRISTNLLVSIRARPQCIPEKARRISSGCDLEIPLASPEINVPLVAKLKNACAMKPEGKGRGYWAQMLRERAGNRTVDVEGVPRIWFENSSRKRQIEGEYQEGAALGLDPQPEPRGSRCRLPRRSIEIDPLTGISDMNFLSHAARIFDGREEYRPRGPKDLARLIRNKITIQRISLDKTPYIAISGPGRLPGYFRLGAIVREEPVLVANGYRIMIDVLDGRGGYLIRGVKAFAVRGTRAEIDFLDKTRAGGIIDIYSLLRLDADYILGAAGPEPQKIPIPIEMIVLSVFVNEDY